MNWIENAARDDIPKGYHHDCGPNSMLIQITDPATEFPTPKHQFKEIHQFEFLDIDDKDVEANPDWEEAAITDEQAAKLVALLQHALDNKMNVVVHCHAGICRSGAVVEIGVMMGFADTERYRAPNLRVKHKMMKVLGWTYDPDEKDVLDWRNYKPHEYF
ncbi:MAG TPA: protein-tyrosine phosphatase family protein [Methanosarcina sp.]|nr:protein-tyrosine phosphatase family protein [Methanosarcina sp.]